jgi:hypothetical protein
MDSRKLQGDYDRCTGAECLESSGREIKGRSTSQLMSSQLRAETKPDEQGVMNSCVKRERSKTIFINL